MKNEKFNKDSFARFIFNESAKIEMYNFDVFYDIKSIMNTNDEKLREDKFPTEKPIFQTYFWFTRNTGTWLCKEEEETMYKSYENNSTNIFKLEFCLNESYFSNQEYCTITKIK